MTVRAESQGSEPDLGLPGDRRCAFGAAHQLLEDLQARPSESQLLHRLEQWTSSAAESSWAEVHVFLVFSALIHADLTRQEPNRIRTLSDELLAAARAYDDPALVGLAMAARPAHVSDAEYAEPFGDNLAAYVAGVVAMLEGLVAEESSTPSMVIPAAYVECAQAYRRHDLWELELEMYQLAGAALAALFGSRGALSADPAVRPVLDLNRRVLLFNRLESTVSLVCALLEIGQREDARRTASGRHRLSPQEWADLPASWALEARAMERLLAVVAGETETIGDPAVVPTDLYAAVAESAWGGYAACLLLAAALANEEAGDLPAAALLGQRAFVLLDDHRPSLRNWAMHVSTLGSAFDGPARRYAAHLARLRWESHVRALEAARSRLSTARLRPRDG